MRYHVLCILILLILLRLCHYAHSNSIFSKNTTIAHPETGLFLDYVGLYKPSESIIHNSAIFPMTASTCHFLPLSAAENIPSCNVTERRNKRAAPVVIALGFGAVVLGMSYSNWKQTESLQKEVTLVERTLSRHAQTSHVHGAYLAKIGAKQIEFAEELQMTQKNLEAMVPILRSHSETLNILRNGFENMQIQFERSFLYSAMTQIYRNKLTLEYLSPDDLHKLVYDVMQQGSLKFNAHEGSLPLVEVITRLLVRQQIDFIPSEQYITDNLHEIGRLVITNFFAIPKPNQTPFYIYKLIAIPFFHGNETIQLAQIPRYWAMNPADNVTIEWHDPEESGCYFELMTSCRDTPPFRPISKDTCFDQIVRDLPLTKCQTIQVPSSNIFLRQLKDNIWISSSPESMHCLKMPKTNFISNAQHTWSMNEKIILPPVAVVNVTPDYVIACPEFTLLGHPILSNGSSLILWYNSSMLTTNISVVDVHKYLYTNSTWLKRIFDEQGVKNLPNFMEQADMMPIRSSFPVETWPYIMLISSGILFGLIASGIYGAFQSKGKNCLRKF